MKPETIIKALNAHGIPNYTKDGRIYADSMISGTYLYEITEDVTNWTRPQLLSWLGY